MPDSNPTSNASPPSVSPSPQPAARAPRPGHEAGSGRFTTGNREALKHGGFSEAVRRALLPEQAEALSALAEKRAELERDLGGADALSVVARDLATRYLELCVVADYLGGKLVTEGPLTAKGSQRAALTAYLGVVDRLQRLALALGLERRAQRLPSLHEVMSGD
jgi:hypothetical protein